MNNLKVLSGKVVSESVYSSLSNRISYCKQNGIKPGLAAILVGDDAASHIYIRTKTKKFQSLGLCTKTFHFPHNLKETELIDKVKELNEDSLFNGILVQLPLPEHMDSRLIIDAIDPIKDADGFHAINVGRNSIGGDLLKKTFTPCTPLGCYLMLKKVVPDLKGMHAVIIGRSNIVGKPMAQLLLEESCTVTIVHSKTKDIEGMVKQADIVVAAVGRPNMVKSNWVKDGAIVIDVGINRIDHPDKPGKTKLVGDVDYDDVLSVASAITPVPGGVGPMTIACLLKNTVDAAFRQQD